MDVNRATERHGTSWAVLETAVQIVSGKTECRIWVVMWRECGGGGG